MYRSAPYDVPSVGAPAPTSQPYVDPSTGGSSMYGRPNGISVPNQFRSGISSAAADDSTEAYISRTLYVCKLPPDFTEAQIHDVLSPFGDLRKITCYPSRQIAFAEYWDIRDAQKARNGLRDVHIGGRQVEIQYSKTRDDRAKEKNTGTLYVRPITTERNFHDPNTLQQYKDLFNRYGEVKKVNTNRKREAEKFIEYHDLRSAEAALEGLNGLDFNGVKLEVQFANQSSKTINKDGLIEPPVSSGRHFRRDPSNSSYGPVRGSSTGGSGGPVAEQHRPATGYWGPPIKMQWRGTAGPTAVAATTPCENSKSGTESIGATGSNRTNDAFVRTSAVRQQLQPLPSEAASNTNSSRLINQQSTTSTNPNAQMMLKGGPPQSTVSSVISQQHQATHHLSSPLHHGGGVPPPHC